MSDNFQWPQFRRVNRRAKRTDRMVDKLDLDPVALARLERGFAMEQVMRTCLQCHNDQECSVWLNETQSAGAEPRFCPNLKTFLKCRRIRETDRSR